MTLKYKLIFIFENFIIVIIKKYIYMFVVVCTEFSIENSVEYLLFNIKLNE